MRHRAIVFGLLAATAATAAQADTLISRQITNEPVETIVPTGPGGTVVTRRPLAGDSVATVPAPVVTAPAPVLPPFPFAPFAAPVTEPATTVVETVETVEQPAVVTREVVRPAPRRAATPARSVSTTRVVERPAARRASSQSVTQTVALTPQQRQVIRRTVLLEQARPAMAQQVISPPLSIAPPSSVRTVTTAPVVQRVNHVGSALPRDVVIYDMPQSVAVPAVRPYSYAIMEDRVLLVDPATRVVIEDLSP